MHLSLRYNWMEGTSTIFLLFSLDQLNMILCLCKYLVLWEGLCINSIPTVLLVQAFQTQSYIYNWMFWLNFSLCAKKSVDMKKWPDNMSANIRIWNGCIKLGLLLGILFVLFNVSRVMRKPTFCICENKDADQLRGNREADQRLCFRYLDSTIPLVPKIKIFSL